MKTMKSAKTEPSFKQLAAAFVAAGSPGASEHQASQAGLFAWRRSPAASTFL
jgi:hypothetical protein